MLIWVISTHNIFHGYVITVEHSAGVEFVAFWLAFYRLEKIIVLYLPIFNTKPDILFKIPHSSTRVYS